MIGGGVFSDSTLPVEETQADPWTDSTQVEESPEFSDGPGELLRVNTGETVSVGVGETYETVVAALSALSNETDITIKLTGSVTESQDITISPNKTVTIDLAGYTLTMAEDKIITILPEGKLDMRNSSKSTGGKLITQNAVIPTAPGENSTGIYNEGTFVAESLAIEGKYGLIWNKPGSKCTINGGDLKVNESSANGNAIYAAIRNQGGAVVLDNIYITAPMTGIYQSTGTLKGTDLMVQSDWYGIYTQADETGESELQLDGGSYARAYNPDGLGNSDYTAVLHIGKGSISAKNLAVSSVGAGIRISSDENVPAVLENCTVNADRLALAYENFSGGKLEVNGGSYHSSTKVALDILNSGASAEVKNATFRADASQGIKNAGTLNLENVTVDAKYPALNNYTDVVNGKNKATATIESGTYTSQNDVAIWNHDTGDANSTGRHEVIVNGGTFRSDAPNDYYPAFLNKNKGYAEISGGTFISKTTSALRNEGEETKAVVSEGIFSTEDIHGVQETAVYNCKKAELHISGGVVTSPTGFGLVNQSTKPVDISGGYYYGASGSLGIQQDDNNKDAEYSYPKDCSFTTETVKRSDTGVEHNYFWIGKMLRLSYFDGNNLKTAPIKYTQYKENTTGPAVSEGSREFIVTDNIPKKDGSVFYGWSDGNKIYMPKDTITISKDTRLDAVWSKVKANPGQSTAYYGESGPLLTAVIENESDRYTYQYQWYKNTSNENQNGTILSGQTGKSFRPEGEALGSMYYYCVVTAVPAESGDEIQMVSSTAKVTTTTRPYIPTPSPLPDNYPEGSVKKPDGSIETPNGTVIQPDGTIILPDEDKTELKPGEDGTKPYINKEGIVTDIHGTQITSDGDIILPGKDKKDMSDDTLVTRGTAGRMPRYNPQTGTVLLETGNIVTHPQGFVQKPETGAVIDQSGTITLPDGTKITPDGVTLRTDGGKTAYDGTVLKPGAVTITEGKVVRNKVTVLTGDTFGASGYDYVISTNKNCIVDKDYLSVNKNITKTSTDFRYLQKGRYYLYCHAWLRNSDGKKVFGKWSNGYEINVKTTTPQAPAIQSAKVGQNGKLTIKVSNIADADGYDLILGSKTGKVYGEKRPLAYGKNVRKNQSKTTITFQNLKKGTYYISAHAYNRDSNKAKVFGPWGNIRKIVIK